MFSAIAPTITGIPPVGGAEISGDDFKCLPSVMKRDYLLAAQCKLRVCPPSVVAELELESVRRENLDDSPDLAPS